MQKGKLVGVTNEYSEAAGLLLAAVKPHLKNHMLRRTVKTEGQDGKHIIDLEDVLVHTIVLSQNDVEVLGFQKKWAAAVLEARTIVVGEVSTHRFAHEFPARPRIWDGALHDAFGVLSSVVADPFPRNFILPCVEVQYGSAFSTMR